MVIFLFYFSNFQLNCFKKMFFKEGIGLVLHALKLWNLICKRNRDNEKKFDELKFGEWQIKRNDFIYDFIIKF